MRSIIGVLEEAKYKLRLYHIENGGKYIGGTEYTDLIKKINDAQEEANRVQPEVRQGRSLPDVACGRVKECEHFLGLTEKLSWLKESEEHDLFVSMIKMRIEFLKQDDNVKKAMTDTLEELINESKPTVPSAYK